MRTKVSIKAPYDPAVRSGVPTRKLKMRLFKKYKSICFYCGIKTIIQHRNLTQNYPANTATVEHLYSKFDMRRALSKKTVLSCLKCNAKKAKDDGNIIFDGYKRVDFSLIEHFNLQPSA